MGTYTIEKKLKNTLYGMKHRCYGYFDSAYHRYGGRGITICSEWLQNEQSFIDWGLKNGCDFGLTIDRVNNDKGYSPDNCRWVTKSVNSSNKSSVNNTVPYNIARRMGIYRCDEFMKTYKITDARFKQMIADGSIVQKTEYGNTYIVIIDRNALLFKKMITRKIKGSRNEKA